ncbi:hypothetical protein SDC9_114480 [bioreactor metagenome]|uniref:Uncharacterized protein n=1 Tax=bioreactor metagenome TaxID=1076179 RepID=A0A645BQP2_9ZZZZ
MQQSGDGVQRGGFSRAVGPDEGDNLSFVHVEGNALDGVNAAVKDVQVLCG